MSTDPLREDRVPPGSDRPSQRRVLRLIALVLALLVVGLSVRSTLDDAEGTVRSAAAAGQAVPASSLDAVPADVPGALP